MKRNRNLEWIIAQNGTLVVRRKSDGQMYSLNGNFILVWLNLHKDASLQDLMNQTKIPKHRIFEILDELKKHGLTI